MPVMKSGTVRVGKDPAFNRTIMEVRVRSLSLLRMQ